MDTCPLDGSLTRKQVLAELSRRLADVCRPTDDVRYPFAVMRIKEFARRDIDVLLRYYREHSLGTLEAVILDAEPDRLAQLGRFIPARRSSRAVYVYIARLLSNRMYAEVQAREEAGVVYERLSVASQCAYETLMLGCAALVLLCDADLYSKEWTHNVLDEVMILASVCRTNPMKPPS